MSKALAKVVVLDLTTEFWASLGAATLGDFGAEVIRIENLSATTAPDEEGWEGHEQGGWNYRFELAHRNKSSLAVALDSGRGGEIVRQLARRADAVITDLPQPQLERRRLDYETVASGRPDIIYAQGSGLGPRGPDRDLPALDELAAARAGIMGILPQPGQPPVYPGHGQMYASMMLAFGVVAALYHHRQTGEGQKVDTSLLAGNMYGASLDLQAYLAIGGERFLHPVGRLDAGNPMSGTLYPTSDGRWVTLTMPDTDRWWPLLAGITDMDAGDTRFDSHAKRCDVNRLELMRLLEEAFRKQPAAHWRALFSERQMSADVIEDYSFPATDRQARRNRYIMDLRDPTLGPLKLIGFPIFMTATPACLRRRAPYPGQHSGAILHDLLGYTDREIDELERDGIVAR